MKPEQLAALLIDVEAALRQLNIWEAESPPTEALASTQPFCIDTMNFTQWLQHVFLPTMYGLLESGRPLPRECGIAAMAEEYFTGQGLASGELEVALVAVDQLFSE